MGAVVILHDEDFSSAREVETLRQILIEVPFSLVLEPIPSEVSQWAAARLPVATYLEESDFVVNAEGRTAPGWEEQRARLEAEGVPFRRNGRADLARAVWEVLREPAG